MSPPIISGSAQPGVTQGSCAPPLRCPKLDHPDLKSTPSKKVQISIMNSRTIFVSHKESSFSVAYLKEGRRDASGTRLGSGATLTSTPPVPSVTLRWQLIVLVLVLMCWSEGHSFRTPLASPNPRPLLLLLPSYSYSLSFSTRMKGHPLKLSSRKIKTKWNIFSP